MQMTRGTCWLLLFCLLAGCFFGGQALDGVSSLGRALLQDFSAVAAAFDEGTGEGIETKPPYQPLLMPGLPVREVCTNACSKARNGVCEEGRPGKVQVNAPYMMAYCDLGTDCEDCGPWKTTSTKVPWENPPHVGPVRYLQSKDVQVRVRAAAVPSHMNFTFAYTDPKLDYDVSYHMEGSGMVEAGITAIAYKLLNGRCEGKGGQRALVVDVGANFGWFAIMAARLGCKVIAYEPVPVFRSFFEYSIFLNDLSSLIEVRPSVVSHEAEKHMKMETIEVPSVRLENDVKSDVLLMKVDVEGWEWAVIKGAEGLFKKYDVESVIMEYSPAFACGILSPSYLCALERRAPIPDATGVKHRCHCTRQDVCGVEEALVLKAAAEGRIAQNYVLK
ncbi:hypothetical protein GPECTOR_65g163 [Gonium pectorale]|uniref:Methyltransferase FkbM domain-containing protein n=1 Tax=Gonium pectorale TaxID=33097 RepID=A0A150G4U1_GONPE|nr:hypothetical protein GPECTOR_65g163 [Gonium pectorale]|eukprot:KXZ44545.1 hypothetical protein GPECTOR_65g163 [Gonium pectorale]